MSMAERIKNIRISGGISQEELAEQVNVSRQTISKWENGLVCPSADNLNQLGKALGVSVDMLLNGSWPPEPQVVEVPVGVPVPQAVNHQLWVLLAALVLAAGIGIGMLLFQNERKDAIPSSTLEGEMIDDSTVTRIPLLPLE